MLFRWGAVLPLAVLLSGCGTLGYYAQAVRGHLALVRAAQPVETWLRKPDLDAELRQRLELAQRMRVFSVQELALPDNSSWRRYAQLQRRAAVWNVVAAPPDSLQLKRWCYPVAGCVGYRGYYRRADAMRLAEQLQEQGLETHVYGVPVYSTLGWLNWLGGDPLLSTVIRYPEGELARLMFHELAHQRVYASGDTEFNESYATAAGELGARQWLRTHGDAAVREEDARRLRWRNDFRALARATRARLAGVYARARDRTDAQARLPADKAAELARFRRRYARLKQRWDEDGVPQDGFDDWVRRANNAAFGLQATYDGLVPEFEALFESLGRDWARWHDAVHQLASQPQAQRRIRLRALAVQDSSAAAR